PALADAAFVQVDAGVRARVGDWARAFRDNCEASHVRHAQSEAMLDLRTQCLGRARAELASLIDLLRKADAATVSRAARAVSDGGDLGPCADPAALGAAIAPPLPLQAAAVGALRDDLSRTTPLFDLGKWPEARAATRALVARARALGYRPLLARVLAQQGHIEANTGEPDAAIRDLYEVAALATAVGDDDVLATALPWLGFALGYGKERYDAAESVHRWAAAEVERAGPTPARRSSLYGNRAVVLGRQGDHGGALAIFRDLRALEAARRGPDSLSAGWADKSIGDELTALGRAREATPYEARAARLVERALGAENPTTATVLAGYGVNLVETFEPQAALAVLARAQAIYERTIGPEDLRVAAVLNTTSVARLALRQLPQARAALEHAIAIHHARDPAEGRNIANEYDVLSDIAQREGKREEAHALAARAIAIKRGVLDPMHEEVGLSYRIDAEHLRALGRIADARAAIDHALAITRKANGEQHPAYAEALIVHGDVLRAEHHDGDAITAYERALAILDPAYGATSIGLCPVLARLSAAVLDAGEPARAEAYAARDLALAVHAAPGEREIAELRLAEARWALAHDRPAALALARHARDGLAALPFPSDDLPRAQRWLASR
ncbi:MAG TPA: tetratricopeptide repeat protein, partial [Kofleriaceae bacterium]|nr:tetratricopeptide repeat protein [Kofleriaceae bacterium]